MKKLISLFLALVLVLPVLAGCGGQAPVATTAETTVAPTTEPAPSGPSQAAIDALDGKKIIFIGNSYTYWGNCVIPAESVMDSQSDRTNDKGLFYQLCKENGIKVDVTNWTFGGHNITDIMSEECLKEDGKCEGMNHLANLTDPYYDYVAMQCYFETEYTGDMISHLKPTMDFFREANPNVKFLFLVPHMTFVRDFAWSSEVFEPLAAEGVLVCNWGGMCDDIVNKVTTVPGGTQQYDFSSFVISRNENDGHHENMLVGYLTALMAYCAITGESAVGQPYAFVDDRSINPNFDIDTYKTKYYTYNTYTNFVDIYRSEADMNGLQQLIDSYLIKYNGGN